MSGKRPADHRVAPEMTEVFRERHFWFSYFACAFGARTPAFDETTLSHCFGIDSAAAMGWWHEFTGWYEGVIDLADGHVDNPGRFEVPLDGGGALVLEAHPGDVYLHRRAPASDLEDQLANFGPHWWLPEWTLTGVQKLAGSSPVALLLMMPLVRIAESDERAAAIALFCAACERLGIVAPPAGLLLAEEWYRRASSIEVAEPSDDADDPAAGIP